MVVISLLLAHGCRGFYFRLIDIPSTAKIPYRWGGQEKNSEKCLDTVDSQLEYNIVDFIFAERVGRSASRLAERQAGRKLGSYAYRQKGICVPDSLLASYLESLHVCLAVC